MIGVASIVSAATATTALATPSDTTYGGTAGGVQGTMHSAHAAGGTLPFTGANLAAVLAAALLLAVVGVVLRRRSSH
jgi:hypothetical protein